MRELMENARMGWFQYTGNGKYAALLLVSLLLFWLGRKEIREKYNWLVRYTTLVAIVCICPVTAALLMGYQTRFYDYQWIWSVVPVTVVIALAATVFWLGMTESYGQGSWHLLKKAGITLVLVALIWVSGGMGRTVAGTENVARGQSVTEDILSEIRTEGDGGTCMLWAPDEILEYVRALDGTLQLVYGRNMWDAALNAYSYDGYGDEEEALYEWMCQVEKLGAADTMTEGECMALAKELGVTHVVLPGTLQPQALEAVEETLGTTARKVGAYYLLPMLQ